MIEKILLDYLNENLGNVKAYAERPKNPPKEYVLLEKTGGGMENLIFNSLITIQSYSDTLLHTAQLNDRVVSIILNALELPEITWVDLNSSYNYTDTGSKQYRYQAVFDVKHY